MPCRDDFPRDYVPRQLEPSEDLRFLNAALCMMIRKHGVPDGYEHYRGSGVSQRELTKWHNAHEEKDAARRIREAKEVARQNARKQALSKLTAEEKEALGIR